MDLEDHFDFDRQERRIALAKVHEGATLYRIASLSHWERSFLLNGGGSAQSSKGGRFHRGYQRTSYAANNILICIAERLFHMYADLIDLVTEDRRDMGVYRVALASCQFSGMLVVFSVKDIDGLIFVDTNEIRTDIDGRLSGTTLVGPARRYDVLNELSEQLRARGDSGVLYPSARHSRDEAIALFGDRSDILRHQPYIGIGIEFRLVSEDVDLQVEPAFLDPYEEKTHPTMGYYRFTDVDVLERARQADILHPLDIPCQGFIDFVRRRYRKYPEEAFVCF